MESQSRTVVPGYLQRGVENAQELSVEGYTEEFLWEWFDASLMHTSF